MVMQVMDVKIQGMQRRRVLFVKKMVIRRKLKTVTEVTVLQQQIRQIHQQNRQMLSLWKRKKSLRMHLAHRQKI